MSAYVGVHDGFNTENLSICDPSLSFDQVKGKGGTVYRKYLILRAYLTLVFGRLE